MTHLLAAGAGGFLGAIARLGVVRATDRAWPGAFPAGTLVVNLIGCFAIGLLTGWLLRRPGLSPTGQHVLQTGFLGSFTTFSTFGNDTFVLLREGRAGLAALNIAVSVVCGLAAVAAGWYLTRAATA